MVGWSLSSLELRNPSLRNLRSDGRLWVQCTVSGGSEEISQAVVLEFSRKGQQGWTSGSAEHMADGPF